jgi:subtilisin family serine protease
MLAAGLLRSSMLKGALPGPAASPKMETTGRSLVLMRNGPEAMQAAARALQDSAGLAAVRMTDLRDGLRIGEIPASSAMLLESIGVAIVNGDPDQIGRLHVQATKSDSVLAVEPERVVYAASRFSLPGGIGAPPGTASPGSADEAINRDYMRGFRDGFDHATGLCFAPGAAAPVTRVAPRPAAIDESAVTWGLQATRVVESPWSGRGIKVAVLDTGFELNHPDFAGRNIVAQSFVAGEAVQDVHGHGTHCVGTALGPRIPDPLPRYGIAYAAEIFVGKVLSNQGSGGDGDIMAGINWAVQNGCRVISMSLGAPVMPGQKPSTVFENTARRALALGTLIVAAAGNDSRRDYDPPYVAPVEHPANCPSIMAVAAIDSSLQVAWFSNGGQEPNGGQVDIAGPGVNVYSSWILPKRYNVISGTSMATPHVAGIVALHAEANPGITAVDLWTRLVKSARSIGLPAADVGSGLVQAPLS